METDIETDRRVEQANESLMEHAEELGKRIKEAREKLNIPAKIGEHPLVAVGAALALGAFLGLLSGGPRPRVIVRPKQKLEAEPEVKRGLITAASAMLGTLVVQFAKDFAVRQLVNRASTWMDRDDSPEARASHVPETESFFKH